MKQEVIFWNCIEKDGGSTEMIFFDIGYWENGLSGEVVMSCLGGVWGGNYLIT